MKSVFEKLLIVRGARVCVALLAGILASIAAVAAMLALFAFFALLAPDLRHLTGPFSIFEVALLVAVPCGSAVAIRALRTGRQRRSVSYTFK